MARPPFPSGWSKIPLSLKNLTLANTLPVGQSFLWHRHQLKASSSEQPVEEFSRAVDNPPRVVCLRQTPNHLYYTAVYPSIDAAETDGRTGITRAWIDDYFHLKLQPDLEKLYDDWRRRDPDLFGKVEVNERAIGVRVLRQDPWECLIALQMLQDEFKGEVEEGLLSWRTEPVEDVRDKLVALKGVGRKVADCVMLMCMDKVHTHVAAIAARHPAFPSRLRNKSMSKQIYEETQQFLLDKWGPMGGWCQAVMFAADLPANNKVLKVETKAVLKDSLSLKRKAETVTVTELKRTRSETRRVMKVVTEVKIE
ncbi:uncharacterized protein I206_103368 [Kwoniella pini CBS 10737]|uniref:DNA-(apurinic or apyrimidinic site) lyase n=1 Tax=Kwoniella pini CBS 10737 TaxID=1296096 RepID=A0AAJ8L2L0_9TREE